VRFQNFVYRLVYCNDIVMQKGAIVMRKVIIFFILMFTSNMLSAETIELKSGEVIEGQIIEQNEEYIKVDSGFGVSITYYLDEINSIKDMTKLESAESRDETLQVNQEDFSPALTKIQGFWVIDVNETIAAAKKKLGDKAPKNIEGQVAMLKKTIYFSIKGNKFIEMSSAKEKTFDFQILEANEQTVNVLVMESPNKGRKITLEFVSNDKLKIIPENDDDFGLYIWQRGSEDSMKPVKVSEVMAEVMTEVLKEGLKKEFEKSSSPKTSIAKPNNDMTPVDSTLRLISTAAETYSTGHNGQYPTGIKQLTDSKVPYLIKDYCKEEIEGFTFQCEFNNKGYKITAIQGKTKRIIKTGGLLSSE